MSNYDDRLKDYVDVKDRIKLFYDKHPDGRLTTSEVIIHTDPDGEQRVMVKALAYRTPDDPVPGAGHSWMVLPGSTPYTKGSEVENTETSAWGRAIGSLGIGIDKAIASGDEVRGKAGDDRPEKAKFSPPDVHEAGVLVGVIEATKDNPDFLPTPEPEGFTLEFKLRGQGRGGGIKVVAYSPIAEDLADLGKDVVVGARVSCWGRIKDESFVNKAKRTVTYQVLELERITGPFGAFPRIPPKVEANPDGVSPLREDAVPVVEGQEQLPFDAKLSAELDALEADGIIEKVS